MLDSVSPASFKMLLDKVQEKGRAEENGGGVNSEVVSSEGVGSEGVKEDEIVSGTVILESGVQGNAGNTAVEEEETKSSGNGSTDTDQGFKEQILKPIRPLDDFLKRISTGNTDPQLIDHFLNILRENGISSYDKGYATVADMHDTIYKALRLLKSGVLKPTKEVTDPMRSCLIVIATLIRNKAVDINSYLLSAEEFAKKIETIKQE
jgi:hypothetical protein